jgi:hypothetical protein
VADALPVVLGPAAGRARLLLSLRVGQCGSAP